MNCPDEKTLSSYLDKELTRPQREEIEQHISECRKCLDLLVVASEVRGKSLLSLRGRRRWPKQSQTSGGSEIASSALSGPPRNDRGLKWLIAALICFILSFIVKRYFLQFLAAAVILGFKWVMEGEGARRAIMIFKGMEPGRRYKKDKETPLTERRI